MGAFRQLVLGASAVVVSGLVVSQSTAAGVVCIDKPNFSDVSSLSIEGDATQDGNEIQLTPDAIAKTGGVYTADPLPVSKGFSTSFDFSMKTYGADGMAFVISANPVPGLPTDPEAGGGGLGYRNATNTVAVEFDTWEDSDSGQGIHIAIHSGGTEANAGDASTLKASTKSLITELNDGGSHEAQVVYKRPKGKPSFMKVSVDGQALLKKKIKLHKTLDLTAKDGVMGWEDRPEGSAWLGISAATGESTQRHAVSSWAATCG